MTNVKSWEQLEVEIDRTNPDKVWWITNNNKICEPEDIDFQ